MPSSIDIAAFFDEDTSTISYLVSDPDSRMAAIVDSVLDYDHAAGRTATTQADRIVDRVRAQGLTVTWILETHAHADHLSAAPYLRRQLGGRIAIGAHIRQVQSVFGELFNAGDTFARDGRQFDHLFEADEPFSIGAIQCRAMHTPGHTPACLSYLMTAGHERVVFVGDTLFMPDYGTARCDFPGGDARTLYQSIRRLLALPDDTRLFLCHDYRPGGRAAAWETTVGAQRRANIHVHDGIDEDAFVTMRTERDAGLGMPRLMLPSVQVNMRAGELPPAEDNGVRYLKIPIDAL
ncbi:MAG: MBL fold metallo-hydrolase [Rhodocyclaceae bacterium]|nr:MBL fold metallo-hydrolase [Rhodocyclaceae bacterium]